MRREGKKSVQLRDTKVPVTASIERQSDADGEDGDEKMSRVEERMRREKAK